METIKLLTAYPLSLPDHKLLVRVHSELCQDISTTDTSVEFEGVDFLNHCTYNNTDRDFTFTQSSKIILTLSFNVDANTAQEKVWIWFEAFVGGNWVLVPSSPKYIEFTGKTEGNKTFASVLFVNNGDKFRVRHKIEGGTAQFCTQSHTSSIGLPLLARSVEMGVSQID